MATITVRNIDAALVAALKELGARHGRSMEAEARRLLADGVGAAAAGGTGLGSRIHARFSSIDTDDIDVTRNSEAPGGAIFEE